MILAKLGFNLTLKSIHLVHVDSLMVASRHLKAAESQRGCRGNAIANKKGILVAELQAQEGENDFDGEAAAVHKIPVEQVYKSRKHHRIHGRNNNDKDETKYITLRFDRDNRGTRQTICQMSWICKDCPLRVVR